MNADVSDRDQPGQPPRDAGTSLTELMTAMFLMTIVLLAIGTVTVLGLQVTGRQTDRIDNVTTAQNGMAAVTKMLRTAVLPDQLDERACTGCAETALVQATATQVSFYANINNTGQGPTLVIMQVVTDPARSGTTMLRQTLVPPKTLNDGTYSFCDPNVAGCVTTKRIVARGLPATGAQVFTYYDFNGNVITASPMTRTDLIQVSSVEVTLKVALYGAANKRSKANTVVQRITLPNADVNGLDDNNGA